MGMSNQTEEKELFHAVSLSGGKDSTAMLLLMIERGLPIDAVLQQIRAWNSRKCMSIYKSWTTICLQSEGCI